jgi:hypothetical protein
MHGSVEFLLTHYEIILTQRNHTEILIQQENQSYILLVTALIAGGGLIVRSDTPGTFALAIIFVFTSLLFAASWRLIRRLADLSSRLVLFHEQATLIRKYFFDADPSITHFILSPIVVRGVKTHHYSPVSKQTSMRILPYLASSMLFFALILGMLELFIFVDAPVSLYSSAVVAIGLGLCMAFSLIFLYRAFYFIDLFGDRWQYKAERDTQEALAQIEGKNLPDLGGYERLGRGLFLFRCFVVIFLNLVFLYIALYLLRAI